MDTTKAQGRLALGFFYDSFVLTTDRIKWMEPYRATRQHARAEWRRQSKRVPKMFRATIIVMAIAIPPFYMFVPGFNSFLPVWRPIVAGLFYPAMVTAMFYLVMFMPRYVEVRRKWIQLSWGQSNLRIPRERIVHLGLHDDDEFGHRLHMKLKTSKGKEFERDIAVRDTVDLDALRGLIRDLNG
jgi:hypothetical protein